MSGRKKDVPVGRIANPSYKNVDCLRSLNQDERSMPRTRTFIALDPGPAIRQRMLALQESLARTGAEVKWVEPENLHLTLLFLGEVDNRELMPVCRAVEQAACQVRTFELAIEGTGCFPNMRRPRIIWIGIGEGSTEVRALHAAIEAPLLELGCYRREERKFTPHITLGKVRGDKTATQLAAAIAQKQTFQAGATMIREVHVMSSAHEGKGPSYSIISRAPLSK